MVRTYTIDGRRVVFLGGDKMTRSEWIRTINARLEGGADIEEIDCCNGHVSKFHKVRQFGELFVCGGFP